MSARLLCCVSLIGVIAVPIAPGSASADTIVIPGITTVDRSHPRPRYRQASFPPPQYDLLGRRVPLALKARPTYRQADNDFPPPGGRFGGGFIEYVLTGGRPEPLSPAEPVSPSPVARFFSPGPYAAPNPGPLSPYPFPSLPLPAPQSPTLPSPTLASPTLRSTTLPSGGLPAVLPGVTQPVYAPPGAAPSGFVEPQQTLFNLPDGGQLFGGQIFAPEQAFAPEQIFAPERALPDAQALAADPRRTRPIDPAFERQEVAYSGAERPGTIIIDTPSKHLFLVQPGGRALRYGIGVGRPGFEWAGVKHVSRKAEWPGWTPPPEMLKRRPDLPRHMVGGEANPLGARALYLGSSMYRIHGTNEPSTIGTNVSSGCIRMMNADVIDLYGRVGVGTRVIVL